MMRSMERLMTGLQGAYETSKKEGIGDSEEILLLEAMAKAKNLEKHVQKAFGKNIKKKVRVHGTNMEL